MPTTPSGMSVADAEALSKKQQQNRPQFPSEGQNFLIDGRDLGTIQGGNLTTINPTQYIRQNPNLFTGQTFSNYGQKVGAVNKQIAQQLGIDLGGLSNFNLADLNDKFNVDRKYGSMGNKVVDLDPFKAGIQTGVDLSTQMTPEEFNANYLANQRQGGGDWIDPATGQPSPMGIGVPAPTTQMGAQISDEADLQTKRKQLASAGIPESEWSNYISSPKPGDPRLYFNEPANFYKDGQKKSAPTGSTQANNLLNSGWSLGDKIGGGTEAIGSSTLQNQPEVNIGTDTTGAGGSLADQQAAAIAEDTKAWEEQVKANLAKLEKEESDLDKELQKLMDDASDAAGDLTGRGAMQAAEEEKRQIEEKNAAIATKNKEIKKKLAEINALTASYQLENQREEGRPQTLSRLQGQQAQNYKMYIAQKNLLVSEASYLQADLLGMQGELQSAQNAANKAVELEFLDRTEKYNALIAQINILKPQVDGEEAKYLQAVEMTLNAEAEATAEKKSLMLNAVNAGITDPAILSQIRNAPDYFEALKLIAQNTPVASVGGGGTTEVMPTDIKEAINISAQQLVEKGDLGKFSNDLIYKQYIDGLMADWGVPEEQRGQVESELNQAMEQFRGGGQEEVASDFETFISAPASEFQTGSGQAGEATRKGAVEIGKATGGFLKDFIPSLIALTGETGAYLTNFAKGIVGDKNEITEEDKQKLYKALGVTK